jgi:predicted Zn finger-like uncharacterized protein
MGNKGATRFRRSIDAYQDDGFAERISLFRQLGASPMSYSIQCIHCMAVLKSKVPAPAGKKVKCARCQQMFTTGAAAASLTLPATAPPPAAQSPALAEDEDEMARAIAKLEAEQTFGKKPAPAESKPVPAVQAPPVAPAPAPNCALSEEDEMAAAIAKLEAEQTFGQKPAAVETKLAPVVETALKVTAVPDDAIPKIDDDLVLPDEEGPTSERKRSKNEDESSSKKKKGHADEEDDEPRTQKKGRRDDEDEEEHSKKKKGRDEDDDEPRSKKKKSRGDEEDEDEERSQKKRKDEEDDEAFTEKPQPEKAKRRAEDGDDDAPRSKKKGRDDDDDFDDEPRRIDKKKTKQKAGSPMMLILLIGGGILGLFGCCGCGIGGYFLFGFGRPDIVGRWQSTDVIRIVYEFRADGTGKMEGLGVEAHFNYSLNGSQITLTNTRVKVGAMEVPAKDAAQVSFRVVREGDTLRFEDYNGRQGARLTLRKIN